MMANVISGVPVLAISCHAYNWLTNAAKMSLMYPRKCEVIRVDPTSLTI
jgi:hypothetical protein